MSKKRGGLTVWAVTGIVIIIIVAVASAIFLSQKIIPQVGEISFADHVAESERELITKIITDNNFEPQADLKISTTRLSEKTDSRLLYNIYVPITDFYDPISLVSLAEAEQGTLIPISELTNQVKLLAIDDHYYLDDFTAGAFFDYFVFEGKASDVETLTNLVSSQLPTFPSQDTVLSLAQTGVTALSRGMNNKLLQVGDAAYFAANIGDFLSQFDLTHTSNEASFSSQAPSNNGTTVICALPAMIDTIKASGFDIIELTGNHNQDCGDEAALATLETYAELGLKTFGGGATAEAAAEPLLINEKNNHITMLGYNLSTGGYTLDNTPGANFYTLEKLTADIAAAKARGDFIIVDVQYYECNNYDFVTENTTCDYANSAAGDQIGLFRTIIDNGADVVIGTAAHQPQTYELYGDGVIYYGLGNLYFDQVWWPGTTRSLILVHYFYNDQLLQTRIVPTIYGDELQTRLMDAESAIDFITRLNQARPKE